MAVGTKSAQSSYKLSPNVSWVNVNVSVPRFPSLILLPICVLSNENERSLDEKRVTVDGVVCSVIALCVDSALTVFAADRSCVKAKLGSNPALAVKFCAVVCVNAPDMSASADASLFGVISFVKLNVLLALVMFSNC